MTIPPRLRSRSGILQRLQSRKVQAPELPQLDQARLTRFEDPVAKFMEMVSLVGGDAHLIDSENQISEILGNIPEFQAAKKIVSLVPQAVSGTVDAQAITDPHDFSDLDWVIAEGDFPVAENGAIWVPGTKLPHRVLLFIPQYLAIVVSRGAIVHHMHDAYAKIGTPPAGFGVFISGPSKTADIEQSLVLGAHGCRTLQVFLLP
jgi:L-lactate dehydrogenase complex protein LldG